MINLLFLLGDVLEKGFIGIILTLDTLIYGLISSAFKVFMAIASARLLSSDAYYTIANKVYLIIGVLMLFVLSYAMLKAIVNPDEGKKSFGPGIIKRIVIAVVGLAIAPALFNLMYQVQGLVLEHNVLGKLFFRSDNTTLVSPGTVDVGGQQVTLEDANPDDYINIVGGSVTATTIWQAFFYPAEDSGLTSDEIVGNLSDYYLSTAGWYGAGCAAGIVAAVGYAFSWTGFGLAVGLLGTAAALVTCDDAVSNLGQAIATDEEITLSEAYAMTAKGDPFGVYTVFINNYVEDGEISYLYGISTIAGAFTLYAFVTFSIDMGVRAAKLAYYQIIAPVPLIMQVLPGKGESTFKEYTRGVIHTFLEVFIRIGVVYIVVYIICHLQDLFSSVDALWGNQDLSGPEVMLAMAFLIIGLIIFCKDAPKFLGKTLGIDGGNLDLGIRNKLAKGGAFTAASAIGGGVTAGVNNMTNKWKQMKDAKGPGEKTKLFLQGFTSGAAGTVSGAVRGGIAGKGAQHWKDVQRGAATGAAGAIRARDNREQYAINHPNADGSPGNPVRVLVGHVTDIGDNIKRWAGFDSLEGLEKQEKALSAIKSAQDKLSDGAKALIEGDVAKGKNLSYGIPATRTVGGRTVNVEYSAAAVRKVDSSYGTDFEHHSDGIVLTGAYSHQTLREIKQRMARAQVSGKVDGHDYEQWKNLYDNYLKNFSDEVQNVALLSEDHWEGPHALITKSDRGDLGSLRADAIALRSVLAENLGSAVIGEANNSAGSPDTHLTATSITGDLLVNNDSAVDKLGLEIKIARQKIAAEKDKIRKKEQPEGGGGGGKK